MTAPPAQQSHDDVSHAELIAAFERGERFALLGHEDPDLDSIGSQLALAGVLRARGKRVRLWSPSPVSEHEAFLPGAGEISTEYPAGTSIDVAVALDTAGVGRFGQAPPFRPADFPVLVNIDHHKGNERFGTLNWVDPRASSVGEMLFELFTEWGVELSADAVTCLYTSILSDTGGFAFANTSARTLQVAGALVERGADPFEIWRNTFGAFPQGRHKLLGLALGTLRLHDNDRIATMRVSQQMLDEAGAVMQDTGRFIQYPRSVVGVEAAAILREQPGGRSVRVGLRSNTPRLDVSRIAADLGGGGHPSASACTVEGSLDQVEHTVVAALADALKEVEQSA